MIIVILIFVEADEEDEDIEVDMIEDTVDSAYNNDSRIQSVSTVKIEY